MLWLFSSDLSLYVLSLLEFKDIFTLYLLSRDIHRYLVAHETAIFHQLAILHRFLSVGISLEDKVHTEDHRGGWLRGVQSWKELCRRCVLMERNWSGKGTVLEGGYLTFDGDVRVFDIDEAERTIIAITESQWDSDTQNLVVHSLDDGRLMWSLSTVTGMKHSNGYLLLSRNNRGLEIWRRAADSLAAADDGPLRAPSPLALTPQQELLLQRIDTSEDVRGRYLPHGFIPSFAGTHFRGYCFRYPLAAVIDREDPHVMQVYDVVRGVLVRRMDLDRLAQAVAPKESPFQTGSALLDIDITGDYICAAFDSSVLIASIHDEPATGSAASRVSAVLFMEDTSPFHLQQTALQLARPNTTEQRTESGAVISQGPVLSMSCSGKGAIETCAVVPPSAENLEQNTQALVRSSMGRGGSSFFVSAKFSPDGRHVVVGTAFALLYLLPDVSDLFSGLARLPDTVQSLNIGEPVRDVLWEEHRHRVLVRTEPGDAFIVDLNPNYHKDISIAAETALRIDGAVVTRFCDFSSMYGTVFGNAHMTKTGIWSVWDLVKLQEDVVARMKAAGKLQYALNAKRLGKKVITVCFANFAPSGDDQCLFTQASGKGIRT